MCIQSVAVVLDEDVSHQITLTREGDVIIGVNAAASLPYVDGTGLLIVFIVSQGKIRGKKSGKLSKYQAKMLPVWTPCLPFSIKCFLDSFNDRVCYLICVLGA